MECMLLPEKPSAPLPKVPYIGKSSWDGGPFLEYPRRIGMPQMLPDIKDPTHVPWEVYEHQHPTPTRELESFFQTWLFFGLISEALDGNDLGDEIFEAGSVPLDAGTRPLVEVDRPSVAEVVACSGVDSRELTKRRRIQLGDDGTSTKPSPVIRNMSLLAQAEVGIAAANPNPNPSNKAKAKQPGVFLGHRTKSNIIARIYEDFIVQSDGEKHLSTRSLIKELEDSWAISLIEFRPTRNILEARCRRIGKCLRQAQYFYTHLPRDFNSTIKVSIGAVAEIIAHAMTAVCFYLNIREFCPTEWQYGDFDAEHVKERMLRHGWCPSDIARTMDKFKSLQALYFISMLDKRQPERAHDGCNEEHCQAYQIDEKTYGLTHIEEGCNCQYIAIDNSKVVAALKQGDSIPLLTFIGDKENLRIEVVKSSKKTPYVTISHVWADGLGNPNGNELHACKLIKLRSLVEALPSISLDKMPNESAPLLGPATECPLIWLDTLCCPVLPIEDKLLSLKKMRQTYEQSSSVLVLDASLQCYPSELMAPVELLARIFTSSWLRRLWTLQEGALAKHLYFQFSDAAISLDRLKAHLDEEVLELRYRIFGVDVRYEIDRIQQFFQSKGYDGNGQNLKILDDALRYRGVSVATDEPLCIGTLMNLPEKPILAVAREDRMRVVWELLAKKYKSIPAQVIFFEENRLSSPGFGWAPASLLTTQKTIFHTSARGGRWEDSHPGYLSRKGLKVKYAGFRLRMKMYNDGKPRQPWKGLKRMREDRIIFRDAENGDWYSVGTKDSALRARDMSPEEVEAYAKLELFPLQDVMHNHPTPGEDSREVFLLLKENGSSKPHLEKDATDGVIISGKFEAPSLWTSYCIPSSRKPNIPEPILAKTQYQVVVGPLNAIEVLLYTTAEQLALQLRASPLTDELLSIDDRGSEEYKEVLERVKQKMKDMMAAAFAQNELLNRAVKMVWGDDINQYLWTVIGDWFNHGFEGKRLSDEQVWFVE